MRARGFSLVEVMVAVVVICVGLLGIAKMQALALSNSNTSRLRSLAALEAASLAATMHANRLYWAATAPQSVTLNAGAIASSDAVLAAQASADLGNLNACVGTSAGGAQCTAANLAAHDLANWVSSLAGLLPNPSAAIACGGNAPATCTIQISWTERAVAINQQEALQEASAPGAAQFENPTYQLYVEP